MTRTFAEIAVTPVVRGTQERHGATLAYTTFRVSSFSQTSKQTENSRRFSYGVLGAAVFAALVLVNTMLVIRPAAAQAACGNRAEILQNLEKFNSERPRAIGLSADGMVVEVLVSTTGSWTILVSTADNLTCVVAVGEAWERLPEVPTGPST